MLCICSQKVSETHFPAIWRPKLGANYGGTSPRQLTKQTVKKLNPQGKTAADKSAWIKTCQGQGGENILDVDEQWGRRGRGILKIRHFSQTSCVSYHIMFKQAFLKKTRRIKKEMKFLGVTSSTSIASLASSQLVNKTKSNLNYW